MPLTSDKPRHPGHLVTAVLVCHDGARSLPDVLDALARQHHQPDRLVAVDIASGDDSRQLVTDRHGEGTVVDVPAGTPFGAAVQAGLDAFGGLAGQRDEEDAPTEWVWLLHDDSAPEPSALDELLVRVTHSPSVWLVGPKVQDWQGEALLEAGLSIDASGHIDYGVEGHEPDQGQRDEIDEVLAVGTAGALIRRDVWDRLGGLDPAWSAYGDDIDLGWRVNSAAGRVVLAPRAIVRHVDAGCVGRVAVGSIEAAELRRRNGMQVVLCNTAGWLVPWLYVRYLVGGSLRALGLLVVARRRRLARAELVAVRQVLSAPGVIRTGRRDRAESREVAYADVRRLLPKAGGRWRNSPLFAAGLRTEVRGSRRQRVAVESGPVSEEAESLSNEISVFGAFMRRPASVLFIVMLVLALIADRHILSSVIHGGRLLPAPRGASDLWSTYFASWHPSGIGSTTPAPTWIGALALLSTVLLGKAWLAVEVLVLFTVPLSALSAFTAMRVVTASARIRVWIAVVYSLLPAVTGAIAGGRLDVMVAAIVLPRIIRAVAVAVTGHGAGTHRGRTVRAGLWLSVGAAFAPLLWPVAVVTVVLTALLAGAESTGRPDLGERLRIAAAIAVIPLVALVPWTWHLVAHPGLLISGSGLPEFYTSKSAPSGIRLALLQAGGSGQPPFWIGIPLLGAAVLGLQRDSRVTASRIAAFLVVIGIGIAVIETRTAGVITSVPASRHWPGLVLLIAGAGALLAGLVAAVGARPALADRSFGWRQPAAIGIVGLALVASATMAAGWLVRGTGSPITASSPTLLPLFARAEMEVPSAPRALILKANGPVVTYAVIRKPFGPQLGEADTGPSGAGPVETATSKLSTAVQDLVAGRPGADYELVPFGIEFIVAPNATAHRIYSQVGQASSLTVLPVPGATVWKSTLHTGELTLLSGGAAGTARAGGVPTNAPQVLNAGPGKAEDELSAASGDRLLVLAEPTGSHWQASLAGKSLERATAYGWAQAFVVPAGAGGTLQISSSSAGRHWFLWLELLALLAIVGVGVAGPAAASTRELKAATDAGGALPARSLGGEPHDPAPREPENPEPEDAAQEDAVPAEAPLTPSRARKVAAPKPAGVRPAVAKLKRAAARTEDADSAEESGSGPVDAEDAK